MQALQSDIDQYQTEFEELLLLNEKRLQSFDYGQETMHKVDWVTG